MKPSDRGCLKIGVHQHCNHFVHPIILLLHSSVIPYPFVRSSFDLILHWRWWLFSHFRWYIFRFSLTTFIWFFAWINILVIWLQNRPIKLCHSTSQQRSWWSSWEGDFFSWNIMKMDQKSEVPQDVLDLQTAAFRDSHLCMQAQVLQHNPLSSVWLAARSRTRPHFSFLKIWK